uniref:hypothetical protein n=1 Tax=Clostridium sp. NkU-1 TaxID=1095009 RepID=UPI0006D00B88
MLESINKISFGVFLLASAWEDGREKAVSVWLFKAAGIAGVILAFFTGRYWSRAVVKLYGWDGTPFPQPVNR